MHKCGLEIHLLQGSREQLRDLILIHETNSFRLDCFNNITVTYSTSTQTLRGLRKSQQFVLKTTGANKQGALKHPTVNRIGRAGVASGQPVSCVQCQPVSCVQWRPVSYVPGGSQCCMWLLGVTCWIFFLLAGRENCVFLFFFF